MPELTPKARYQENEEAARLWRGVVDSGSFHNTLTYALAEFSQNYHPTTEELNGARTFLGVLLNLAEVEQAPSKLPPKRLSIISDTRKQPTQQTQRSD